jgi:hypothetical protein
VSGELYQSARRFRIFTARPITANLTRARELVGLSPRELEHRLTADRGLL